MWLRLFSTFIHVHDKWIQVWFSVQRFQIRYRPNAPLVLKGISCRFEEGSRVGVVGRTGSGKTTLISALFCLVEPTRGDILIDGINICSIGLKDLRTKLSIIPQEPTLFKGSIQKNLDPLCLYSDYEIWKVNQLALQLKKHVIKWIVFLYFYSLSKGFVGFHFYRL